MKRLLMIIGIVLIGIIATSAITKEKVVDSISPSTDIVIIDSSIPDLGCGVYGLRCDNPDLGDGSPCTYETWHENGCQENGDPYNACVMCPLCYWTWLTHVYRKCPASAC